MTQQVLVILLVAAAALWLAFMVYRHLRPKPGNSPCGGSCCTPAKDTPAASDQPRTPMISSDDLRARLKTRKT